MQWTAWKENEQEPLILSYKHTNMRDLLGIEINEITYFRPEKTVLIPSNNDLRIRSYS